MDNSKLKFTKIGKGHEVTQDGNFILWVAGSKRSAEKEIKKLGLWIMGLLKTTFTVTEVVLIEKLLHRTIRNNIKELIQMDNAPECSRQIQEETNAIQQILNDLK